MINESTEKRKDLDILKSNETYLLGVLATDYEEFPTLGETSEVVTKMRNKTQYDNTNMMFYIKAVSEESDYIRNIVNEKCNSGSLYVGIDKFHRNIDIYPFGYKDQSKYNLLTDEDKKAEIYNELKGRLLLFKPVITFDQSSNRVYKNVKIQQVLHDYMDGLSYRSIPVIKKMNYISFESKLLHGEYIYLENYNNNMLPPEFIICDDYIYTNFQSWKKHDGNYKLWKCDKGQGKIKKMKIDFAEEDYDYDVLEILDYLSFISEDFLTEKIYNMADKSEYVFEDEDIENNEDFIEEYQEQEEKEVKQEEQGYNNNNDINNNDDKESIDDNKEKDFDEVFKSTSIESKFLKKFKDYTVKHNLCYDVKDLVNFHVSIKTNQLTIVAGMSGTGKTQIARAYANTLGIREEDNTLLFLPISPSYTEPEDIIGYLNNTMGLYVASETGLVDFLIHAEEHKDKMHMVIFDEMNLSQVEYWFAPFISLLELQPKDRNLKLYSKGTVCHNSFRYKSSVNIGDNIIFVGTVNLDETTKDFSDRLLDRANIVTLKKRNFTEFRDEIITSYNMGEVEKYLYTYEEYKSWIDHSRGVVDLSTDELDFFDELHDIIQKYDIQKGVSFRILEKICSYINNIPEVFDEGETETISRREAFDIEIKQRILTKLKGSERQFGGMIGKFDINSNDVINSELYNFFNSDKASKISDFYRTKEEIIRKSKELTLYGYTN